MRRTVLASFIAASCLATAVSALPRPALSSDLPERLTDQQFWKIVTDASEPGGYFRSENITNLTSNELGFEYVIPDLLATARTGGVYLGVGPEQNYTYIAALRPALAVIFDIRRGNLDLQLMYKAIFELARDRSDFVAMLFSKPRPLGVFTTASAADLFAAVGRSAGSDALYQRNLQAIEHQLTKVHGLPLPAADLAAIGEIFREFCWSGFALRPSPTYDQLMTATDLAGESRSYLATDENFAVLKDLESRNLIIPVVGDFGGPKAIRSVAQYLHGTGAIVSAFYLSNVEQYLLQDGKWATFCRNVTALPLDRSSTFIRSQSGGGGFSRGPGFVSSLGPMAAEVRQGCP